MPQFHETRYGQRFFQHQLPELIKSINRIASAIENQNAVVNKEKVDDEFSFADYVQAESIRQWKDNQAEEHGPWEEQSDDDKAEYYNEMYSHLTAFEDKKGEI